MLNKVKDILIEKKIFTLDEIDDIFFKVKSGEKFEDIIEKTGKLTREELKKIIVTNLYFEKKTVLDSIESLIEDSNKLDKFREVLSKKLTEKDSIEELILSNVINEIELAKAKAKYYELEYIHIEDAVFSDEICSLLGAFDREYIKEKSFLIIGIKEEEIIIGMVNPDERSLVEELNFKVQKKIKILLLSRPNFKDLYNQYLNSINIIPGLEDNKDEDELNTEDLKNEENPVVKLVSNILEEACRKGASDIHIEPYKNKIKIKNRIDGILIEEALNIPKSYQNMIISRIKILSNLNIAEHRIPQDGRFKKIINSKEVDFRVSILPTAFAESAVIRILSRKDGELSFEMLGIKGREKDLLLRNGLKPHGMVLVTGPTGSGKTTTLYATLQEIKKQEEKFITIEDPVEYQIDDVVQIPVNEKTGLTFAKGLRAILRQDPDKVMVGEIRDKETAEIAVQAALTGHLVLTTLHSNSTIEAIGRLINIGVDPFQFSTALNLVIGQRLMRKLCTSCKGEGCSKCDYQGYKGRIAVYELFELNEEIKEMIIQRESPIKIKEKAIQTGMIELKEVAKAKVKDGTTSIKEYERTIGEWE